VNISNPVFKKVKIANNRLVTTKKDRGQHGYGSLNVKECVERYNGNINYSCDGNHFVVEVLFYDINN
jgi:sensor histidine kinase regulating citrate/malate metabolism